MNLRDELLLDNDEDPLRAAVAMARDLERGDRESLRVGYTRPNAVLAAIELFPEVTADELLDAIPEPRTFRVRILVEEIPEGSVEGLSATIASMTAFASVNDARAAAKAAASALRRHVIVGSMNAETEAERGSS